MGISFVSEFMESEMMGERMFCHYLGEKRGEKTVIGLYLGYATTWPVFFSVSTN